MAHQPTVSLIDPAGYREVYQRLALMQQAFPFPTSVLTCYGACVDSKETLYIINELRKNNRRIDMKRTLPTAMIVLVLVATALSFAGCAGNRFKLRTTMTASLQTVQGDLELAQLQTRETEAALNELVLSPEADLRQGYEAFSESADKMTGIGARLLQHADGIHYRGRAYLVEPETSATECRYPRLSSNAGTRTVELGDEYDPIDQRTRQVKRAFRALDFDLSMIRDHLSAHLTPKGVETMTVMIKKAQVDVESLDYALQQALVAVQDAKTAQTEAAPEGATTQ